MKPEQKQELENMLLALVGIANRTKPGQVTHKIEEIKTFVFDTVSDLVISAYEQGRKDQEEES